MERACPTMGPYVRSRTSPMAPKESRPTANAAPISRSVPKRTEQAGGQRSRLVVLEFIPSDHPTIHAASYALTSCFLSARIVAQPALCRRRFTTFRRNSAFDYKPNVLQISWASASLPISTLQGLPHVSRQRRISL
ncbi:hypothetical protein HMN09_00886700 [Mycena chlorophos]|uniref:Uncharacterized protein n=1 Tax=Mycena chlorophos TaxID=658473 RepID=A0A8H6W5I2_MYCCL|nr:hypothetical protein HMN09_00886700 [Mycena chlorophos]